MVTASIPYGCSPARLGFLLLAAGAFLTAAAAAPAKWTPGHYHFDAAPAGRVTESTVTPEFRGAVIAYSWRNLEPAMGQYDWTAIDHDIAALAAAGKKLIILLQYKTFARGVNKTPAYISGPAYGGGVYQNLTGGYDPVMWEPAVRARYEALLTALGARYDGNPTLEAVKLPESGGNRPINEAGGRNETTFNTALARQGAYTHFSKTALTTQILAYVRTLGAAFPNTNRILHATGHDMLDGLVSPTLSAQMTASDVGLGNPDVIPTYANNEYNDIGSGYDHYPAKANLVPLCADVQGPDYSRKRADGTPVSVREFYEFGKSNLKLTHMTWSLVGRPGIAAEVRAFLAPIVAADPAGGLNAQAPASVSGPSTVPIAPTNLMATVDGTAIKLRWTNPAGAACRIERRAAEGSDGLIGLYAPVATTIPAATDFTDTTAVAGTTYSYIVQARDGTRSSAYAGPVRVSIP